MKANNLIREEITRCKLKHWQVAYRLGISDGHFARILRRECAEDKRNEILAAINTLREEAVK